MAVLMLIAVVIVGALVVYAWVMGYISFSTEGAGEAIKIPSIANDPEDTDLLVYVLNVGEIAVQLDEDECLYVNGVLVDCAITGVSVSGGVATLNPEDTAVLRYVGGAALPDEKFTVKVTTVRGTSAEKSGYPAGAAYIPPALNHFTFDVIESPQTSGRPFNVTVWAVDQYDNVFVGYSGANTFTYSAGEINPILTLDFSDGVWTGTVRVIGASTDATITTVAQSNSSWMGTSNPFEVIRIEPLVMWNRTYGGPEPDSAYSLVATSDGGYAIAGGTGVDFTGGGDDCLIKTDAYGNMEWNKTYGRDGSEEAYSVIQTSDSGYALAGSTTFLDDEPTHVGDLGNCDFLLVKTDQYGNMEWNQTYGGPKDDIARSLVATSDGGYAIAGSTTSYGAGGDFWLIKIDGYGRVP